MKEIRDLIEGRKNSLLIHGLALDSLRKFPSQSIDCVVTSPPYWKMREYDIDEKFGEGLVGAEDDFQEYIKSLLDIFTEVHRILTPQGSLWLNLGDKYHEKRLLGLPWRTAIALQDCGWILRNDVIWNQMKGTQSPKDRLRNIHEHLFHFVKQDKYFYDANAIRIKPEKDASMVNGLITSATGVSGKKYRKQILESETLSSKEKKAAINALESTLDEMRKGEVVDFRMTIRGSQRAYHSESKSISGRAKELEQHGYYILKSRASGFMPSDVWNIVPEDKWRKDSHCAVFPEELVLTPIKATCPVDGIVLDPFCGTGTTLSAALKLGRKSVGIDQSSSYLKFAKSRIEGLKACENFSSQEYLSYVFSKKKKNLSQLNLN